MDVSSLPTVSVITPCYNGTRYLRETIESVLAQTHSVLEMIVVDDGSTDDSAAVAESFGPPVRVIRQANQGESVARNVGMDAARGDWIAFLDADDLWKPEKIERQLHAANNSIDVVHTEVYCFGGRTGTSELQRIPMHERYKLTRVASESTFHPSSIVIRRTVETRFPPWTQWGEDLVFALDISRRCRGRIALIPEALSGYRHHNASQQGDRLAVWCRVHDAVNEWIRRNEPELAPEEIDGIQRRWMFKLLKTLNVAKWKRSWDDFNTIRSHLATFQDLPQVSNVLRERIYPPWMYSLKDGFDSACRRIKRRPNGLNDQQSSNLHGHT